MEPEFHALECQPLQSDVDLALWGEIDGIGAAAIATELDKLPLPHHFDVKPFALIKLRSPLLRKALRLTLSSFFIPWSRLATEFILSQSPELPYQTTC